MGNQPKRKRDHRTDARPSQLLQLLKVSLGAMSVFSAVAGVIYTAYFWIFLGLGYFGLAVIIWVLWLEPSIKLSGKMVGTFITLFFGIFIAVVVVFPSAPLEVQINRYSGNFKDGEIVNDIPWKVHYSELRVAFFNHTDVDYESFDMLIETDIYVAKIGWVQRPPSCTLYPFERRVLDARTNTTDEKGNITERLMSPLSYPGQYKLYCDKLLRRDLVQIVFALVGRTPQEALFGPKILPKWASVKGSYKVLMRPYSKSEMQQFN